MTQDDENQSRRPARDRADEPAPDGAETVKNQGFDEADDAAFDAGTDQSDDHEEPHGSGPGARLNWLRAGVLGSNDGIVSTGAIVLGVAGAAATHRSIVTAGIAGLFAGALSMGAGEYVSVSGQRDVQRMLVRQERWELEHQPDAELRELARIYQQQGLSGRLARRTAEQRTKQDALGAHAEAELGIDLGELRELTNPWRPALASFVSFALGALLPLLTIALTPASARVEATFGVSALSLLLTGAISARLGKVPSGRAIARNMLGGLFALAVTYGIGALIGTLFL